MAALPPHDTQAEESVAGSLLIDGSAIEKVIDILQRNDFYSERTKYIYDACLALYQRSESINQITIAHELDSRGRLTDSGGAAYLSYLISSCPTPLDIEDYSEIVHKLAMHRKFIQICLEDAETGYDTKAKIEDTIDKHLSSMDTIKPARSRYLELSSLRIIKSKPPHYIMEVIGEDMSLSQSELLNWTSFRRKVMAERDFIPIKPKNWETVVNKQLEHAYKMEAPIDTSAEVEIQLSIKRWFDQRGEGSEYSDIQSGCYAVRSYRGKETNWEQRDYWVFQVTPLLRWLKRDLGKTTNRDNLWAMAQGWGIVKGEWRIGKNPSMPVKLWGLPPSFAEEAEFALEKQEELPETEEAEEELPNF